MESSAAAAAQSKPPSRRRNSIFKPVIVDVPPNLISLSDNKPQYSAADFKFVPTKPLGYTSLKDILPSGAIQSPTAAPSPRPGGGGGMSAYDIPIRNPLVKQAAWAYLQPMSAADGSGGRHFLYHFWDRISGDIFGCLRSMASVLRQALSYLIRAIRFMR